MRSKLGIWPGVMLAALVALLPVPAAAGRLFPDAAFSFSPDYGRTIWAQWAIGYRHWPVHYEFSPDFYGAEYALWEIPCWNDPYHYLFDYRFEWDEYAPFRWRDTLRLHPRPAAQSARKDPASPKPGARRARGAPGLCGTPIHDFNSRDAGAASSSGPAYSSGRGLSVLSGPSSGSSKQK